VSDADDILRTAESILLVDWPSADVPETLTRAGYTVYVKGGPGPGDYSVRELRDGEVVSSRVGRPPAHADLVYSFRPVSDLPGIIDIARQVGAVAVWQQSGRDSSGAEDRRGCWMPEADSRAARGLVEAAGLRYVDAAYIADTARQIGSRDR
jgi:predicted CoA-binding protein